MKFTSWGFQSTQWRSASWAFSTCPNDNQIAESAQRSNAKTWEEKAITNSILHHKTCIIKSALDKE